MGVELMWKSFEKEETMHDSLNPRLLCHPEKLEQVCVCPECRGEFPLGSGAIIQTHYRHNNEEHWGWLAFHSETCLVRWMPALNKLPI